MAEVTLADINLADMEAVCGTITSVGCKKTIENFEFTFDKPSKVKLANILMTNNITRSNQLLRLESIIIERKDEETLTTGTFPFDNSNKSPYFWADFGFFASSKIIIDGCLREFYISVKNMHLSFDFSDSRQYHDNYVEFGNVALTIYHNEFSVEIVQDES